MVKIFCLNVNGIRSFEKFHKIPFNNWLLGLGYDIYCFQEIRGNEVSLRYLFTLDDFCTFASFHPRAGRHGVATLVRKDNYCCATEEVRKGRILKTIHSNFVLYNCYMPYCSDESLIEAVMETYDKLTDVLNKEQHPVVILCGDMNATYSMCDNYLYMREYEQLHYVSEWSMSIDHISKVENPIQRGKLHTKDFYMKLQMSSENGIYTEKVAPRIDELPVYFLTKYDLYDHFMEKRQRQWLANLMKTFVDTFRIGNKELFQYTCWDRVLRHRESNLGTRIDYILLKTTSHYKIKSAEIRPDIYGSDHCPVTLEIDIGEPIITIRPNLVKKKNNLLSFITQKHNVNK